MAYLKLPRAMPVHFKINTEAGSGALNEGVSVYMNLLQSDFPGAKEEREVAQSLSIPQIWSTDDTTIVQIQTDSTNQMILGVYNTAGALIYASLFADVTDTVYYYASVDWSDAVFTEGECYTMKILRLDTLALGGNLITDGNNGTMSGTIASFTTGNDNFASLFPGGPCSGDSMLVVAGPSGSDRDRFLLSSNINLLSGACYQVTADVYIPSISGIINTPQPKVMFEVKDEHPPQNVAVFSDAYVFGQVDWQDSYDSCDGISMTFMVNNDTAGAIQIITDRIAGVVAAGNIYIDNVELRKYNTFVIEATSDPHKLISPAAAAAKTFKLQALGSGLTHNLNYNNVTYAANVFFRLLNSNAIFMTEVPEMNVENYRDSAGYMLPVNNVVQMVRKLQIIGLPWYYQHWLAYFAAHPTFLIDSIYYALKGDVKLSRQEKTILYDGTIEFILIADGMTYSDGEGKSDDNEFTQC